MKKLILIISVLFISNCASSFTNGVSACNHYKRNYEKLKKEFKGVKFNNRNGAKIVGSELMKDELNKINHEEKLKMAYKKYQDCIDRK